MDLYFSLQASYLHILQFPRTTWPWRGRSMKWRLSLPRELLWSHSHRAQWPSLGFHTSPYWRSVADLCVRASSVLGRHLLERHRQTPQLCVGCQQSWVPWKGGAHREQNSFINTCVYSKPSRSPWAGNSWTPPCHPQGAAQRDAGTEGSQASSPAAGSRGSSSCCTSRVGWPGSPRGPRCPRCAWLTPGRARTACGQSSRSPPLQSTPSAPSGFLSRICWRSPCQVWLIKQNK